MVPLTADEIAALKAWPTPAVANAIETFDVRPRSAGFMLGIRCCFPEMGPMVGYACTARMAAREPAEGSTAAATQAHWDNILATPEPRVAVIQDLDDPPAFGSLWGEVNANIHRALGCVGVVTDGGVRDLDEGARARLPLLRCRGHPDPRLGAPRRRRRGGPGGRSRGRHRRPPPRGPARRS